jgi:hypothetical protein
VGGGAQDTDAPGGAFDDGEDVLALAGQGDGLDEVPGQEGTDLGTQEVDTLGPEEPPDGGGSDPDAEGMGCPLLAELGEEVAVDTPVAQDGFSRTSRRTSKRMERTVRGRPGALGSGGVRVPLPRQVAVPSQYGVRSDHQS